MALTIDPKDLRIGMYVHLDVGWLSHPFPLSSFKITSAEQLATIHSLRLKRVRWIPERSDPDPAEPTTQPGEEGPLPDEMAVQPADAALPSADGDAPVVELVDHARDASRHRLDAQRAAAAMCEAQFAEACRDLRAINDHVAQDALGAGRDATGLAQALLDKMMVDGELCVRVLEEAAGERGATHALNVSVIGMLLGRALNYEPLAVRQIGVAGLVHDIGKLELPDRVRLPRADFTHGEATAYREHVSRGVAVAQRMALDKDVLLAIAQHHEHADGSGFPSGIALDRMSTVSRVVSLVNAYDNLCNPADPAQAMTPHEALSRMFAQCRSRFDVDILNVFIRMMGIYPPGSVVQLSDERFAMVMTVNPLRPLKPRVLVVDDAVPSAEALYLDLETTPELGIKRSLRGAQLPASAQQYLRPRRRVAYYFDVDTSQVAVPRAEAAMS